MNFIHEDPCNSCKAIFVLQKQGTLNASLHWTLDLAEVDYIVITSIKSRVNVPCFSMEDAEGMQITLRAPRNAIAPVEETDSILLLRYKAILKV